MRVCAFVRVWVRVICVPLCFSVMGSLCSLDWPGIHLCSPGLPQARSSHPASASQVLGENDHVVFYYFLEKNFLLRHDLNVAHTRFKLIV